MNYRSDDIEYAIENSHILREPDRRIDTFGATRFKFVAISQLMDDAAAVRIRTGEVEAQKPQIIKPTGYNDVELDGFDDKAKEFIERLREKGMEPSIFQYGFQFRRTEGTEEVVHDQFDNVKDRVLETAKKRKTIQ